MQMDSKVTATTTEQLRTFIMRENRYAALARSSPQEAERLHKALTEGKNKNLENIRRMSEVSKLQAGVQQKQ